MSENIFEMTSTLAHKLKNGAKTGLLREYSEYLLENGIVKSKKECLEKIGPVISHMMDMGDCTAGDIDMIESYLKHRETSVFAKRQASLEELCNRGIRIALEGELDESLLKKTSEEEQVLLKKYSETLSELQKIENELSVISSDWVQDQMQGMVNKYHKLFEPEFVEVFK